MTSEVVFGWESSREGRERGGAGRMTERRVNWIGISLAGVVGCVLCHVCKASGIETRPRHETRDVGMEEAVAVVQ